MPPLPARAPRVIPTLLWTAALAAAHLVLARVGAVLPAPRWRGSPAATITGLQQWVTTTDPVVAAFTILRFAAWAALVYVSAVTALAIVASVTRQRVLLRTFETVAAPALRRGLRHIVGAGLAVSISATSAPLLGVVAAHAQTPAPPPNEPVVTMQLIESTVAADDPPPPVMTVEAPPPVMTIDSTVDPTTPPLAPAPTLPVDPPAVPAPDPEPVMTAPAPGAPETDGRAGPTPPTIIDAPAMDAVTETETDTPATAPPAADPDRTWVIAPGDHLWHVAESTLADAWQRPPTTAEIVDYWHELIDLNDAVFRVPGCPDLVVPGQVFALPPVTSSGSPPRSPADDRAA